MKDLEELIKYAESKNYKVEFVGKEELHDYAGMNPEAAKAMGYEDIEHNELQLDKYQDEETQAVNLRHEIIEKNLMKAGLKYFPAHVTALKLEGVPLSANDLDTLAKLGVYEVAHIHNDGNITVRVGNREFNVGNRAGGKLRDYLRDHAVKLTPNSVFKNTKKKIHKERQQKSSVSRLF